MGQESMRPEEFRENRDQIEITLDETLLRCVLQLEILEKRDEEYFGEDSPHAPLLTTLSDSYDAFAGYRGDSAILREELLNIMQSNRKNQNDMYLRKRRLLHHSIVVGQKSLAKVMEVVAVLDVKYHQSARTNGDLNGAWGIFRAEILQANEYMKKIIEMDANDSTF